MALSPASLAVSVESLLDGERSVLAMAADLTRLLACANPQLNNAAAELKAALLIAEIELRIHPGWQRRVVQ